MTQTQTTPPALIRSITEAAAALGERERELVELAQDELHRLDTLQRTLASKQQLVQTSLTAANGQVSAGQMNHAQLVAELGQAVAQAQAGVYSALINAVMRQVAAESEKVGGAALAVVRGNGNGNGKK